MGNYQQGADEAGGEDDGGQQPMMGAPNNNKANNGNNAAASAASVAAAAAAADGAGGHPGGHGGGGGGGGGGLFIDADAGGGNATTSAWSALFGGGFSRQQARGQQSPSHAAGPMPRAPTRYRVLPRGAQGLWSFRRAVEVTLERRGYDYQLWAGLEAGWEPEPGAGAAEAAAAPAATTATTTVVSSSGAVVGVGVKRRQPGATASGASAASAAASSALTAAGRPGQRRPPLPAQLLPAILRWADVCKEVTLLKMEDVHVANGDHVYLRYAIPEALHGYKVVAALVVVQAHDQGWSSFPEDHNTTRGSCTWADVLVEAPQRETTCSRPNVVARAELYRNLHAVRRWQTHVARLEDYYGELEEAEAGHGKEDVGEEERARRAVIGREEEATPPSSPGHPHPAAAAAGHEQEEADEQQEVEEESEAARAAREAQKRAADRVGVVRALVPGATLCLQLSARYPGWVHFARHASVALRFVRDE